jgi:hypothetical protein
MGKFSLDVPVQRRPIVAHDSVTVDLPFPPSVNNLFANGKSGRYTTQQYADWQKNAGWKIKADRPATRSWPGEHRLGL